ncbi:hypothetical protein LEN26_009665 [Aphanomyces euteiches]|nr:hypothetical protein AeMF1_006936 [Aphanomyces euteiches]KAH9124747.1 hypothetical protein LEN26_009665 [Aphanomyces euteiches]KAH9180137.1 hypothetical protein AeNC1_017220 [Aphanomyces euteiches]
MKLSNVLLLVALRDFCDDEESPLVELDITKYERNDALCKKHFRFTSWQISEIVCLLQVPLFITLTNGARCSRLLAMYVLLKRMAYPCRLVDLEHFFGLKIPLLSRILTYMVGFMYRFRGALFWDHNRLKESVLATFADAIARKGSPLNCVVGFIDGTVRPICRPSKYQRQAFNGHKRVHALKFHCVSTPDGLIVHLSGPWIGRSESQLSDALDKYLKFDCNHFVIYGDPAYGLQRHICSPYKGANLTTQQKLFNRAMSKVRVSVEWCFGSVVNNWSFVDFKKNLKVYLQPVGKMYIVAALHQNIYTCYHGNNYSAFFDCTPPNAAEYIQSLLDQQLSD